MTKEQRTDFQYYTAAFMLLAGIILSIAGFIVPPVGEISDSVLWLFAQCLIYAGSIFGVGIYIQSRFSSFKDEIKREFKRNDDGK